MFKNILEENEPNVALVIGNGINRYNSSNNTNSWDQLLVRLGDVHGIDLSMQKIGQGITHTEIYDVIDLHRNNSVTAAALQREFCLLMSSWAPLDHHGNIVNWATKKRIPILTTNFDELLSTAGQCEIFPKKVGKQFTAYYPWERYYGKEELNHPDMGFGIWHINGMQKYPQSIRLGLSHYMGSVERSRRWVHRGNELRLFSGKDRRGWYGANTWLHIIFNRALAIFGLQLDANEVFFRWLLIERAKYYKKFPERFYPAWYFYQNENELAGKLFFLERLGVTPVHIANYSDIYDSPIWLND